jgi:hypothetical protein
MPAATTTRSTITRIGQAVLGVIAAATLIAAGPGTATAATSSSPASPSHPLQVSSCQGKLTGPEKAGPVNINFSSWTLCFGDVVWIHTYVELQRYAERRDGWEWVTVAGPREKSYPGVTGGKVYNNQWVSCPEAGGSGRYREAGWAKWANSEGEIGTTYHAYKTAKIEC